MILAFVCQNSKAACFGWCCGDDPRIVPMRVKPYPEGSKEERFPELHRLGEIDEENPTGPFYGSRVYGPYCAELQKNGRFPINTEEPTSVKHALHWAAVVAQSDPTFPFLEKTDPKTFFILINRVQTPYILEALPREETHNFASRITFPFSVLYSEERLPISTSTMAVLHVLAETLSLDEPDAGIRGLNVGAKVINSILNRPELLEVNEEGEPAISNDVLRSIIPLRWTKHWEASESGLVFRRRKLRVEEEAKGSAAAAQPKEAWPALEEVEEEIETDED